MPATFQPAAPVGHSVDAAIGGIEAGQSMMQRASAIRQSQQMERMREQQMQEAQILMPVIRAKAQADQISAIASIANNTRMEEMRGRAAATSKLANDEFLDVMQLADWNTKSTELAALQAKYQWMSLIPEYKGFVDVINEERIKAHGSAMADARMEQQLEEERIRYDRALEVAQVGAGARKDVADTNAGARVAATTIATEGRATVAEKGRETRIDLAKFKTASASALQADKDAAKAAAAGDAKWADLYSKHAAEFRAAAEAELAKPGEPVQFDVPNTGERAPATAPEDTPAQEDTTVEEPKLYQPPEREGEVPSLSPAVKKSEDVIKAFQQMVDDGVITADQARETLLKLKFQKKGG